MAEKLFAASSSELNAYLRIGIDATYISHGIVVDEKIPIVTAQKEKSKIVTTGRIIAQNSPICSILLPNISKNSGNLNLFGRVTAK